ncbi:hypothetical protein HNQ07_004775 [Deinococcus metalli]|nr:hypothetical protein [Deinococcus metalli]
MPSQVHHFRPANGADLPALRAFFDRVLERGGELFDAIQPMGYLRPSGFLPSYDVWMATRRGKVVAAGWFHLLDGGAVSVVALTDPRHDQLTDSLLACIEAGLQVIAYDGRFKIKELMAWVPGGEPGLRLERAYLQRGWTVTVQPWVARLHRVTVRRNVLLGVVAEALAAGIELRRLKAQPDEVEAGGQPSLGQVRPEAEVTWMAYEDGRPVATGGMQVISTGERVTSVFPGWLNPSALPDLVSRALLAAVLLHSESLPDALMGTGDLGVVKEWFEGVMEVEIRKGYTRVIDASREPWAWEFVLGFNPNRVWLRLRN